MLKNLMGNDQWKKVFCLSYYYQEKALPLTYLYNPMTFYEKYIQLPHHKSRYDILASFRKLGKVKNIKLFLFEQQDDREWVKDDHYGGQYIETFIHIALLNKLILGSDTPLEDLQWEIGDYEKEKKSSYIICKGKTEETQFELHMGKFVNSKNRGGTISYENGEINIDFETTTCKCTFPENSSLDFELTLKPKWFTKYSIQLDMAERCFIENIPPSTVDGSLLQIKTLEWLFNNDLSNAHRFVYKDDGNK